MYSIDCQEYKLNGESFTLGEEKKVETINNKEIYATFFILCSDKEDNNSFNLEYYGDDKFVVEKNRCEINVYIKENKTPYDKEFTIICRHSNDDSLYIQIELIQKGEEYILEIANDDIISEGENKYSYKLKSIIQEKFPNTNANLNYNYYDEHSFDINVTGGSKKYRIESILRCHEDSENENQITYYPFDNGFIYNKFNDKLVLINYGRPFINEKDYYIIKICHEDYRELAIELKITYQSEQRRNKRKSSSKHGKEKTLTKQVSDIYMPYNDFMEKLKTEQTIQSEINNVNVEIRFDEEIGKEFIVNGQRDNISLPFKVFENGEESNLEVRASSTGNWCIVTSDETNRKLNIKIYNKPLGERKSRVEVSVVDYPMAYITFILVNKPQEIIS